MEEEINNSIDWIFWKNIFSIEMFYISKIISNQKIINYLSIFYILTTLFGFYFIVVTLERRRRDENEENDRNQLYISFFIIKPIQILIYMSMPYFSYFYCRDFMNNKSIIRLFKEGIKYDKYSPIKYIFISHLNFLLVSFSITIYCVNNTFSSGEITMSTTLSSTYFAPFCWAYVYNICIMETFRLRLQKFSIQIQEMI